MFFCMHKMLYLWFVYSSVRMCCLAEDSPSMLTDIPINAGPEVFDILVGVVLAPL